MLLARASTVLGLNADPSQSLLEEIKGVVSARVEPLEPAPLAGARLALFYFWLPLGSGALNYCVASFFEVTEVKCATVQPCENLSFPRLSASLQVQDGDSPGLVACALFVSTRRSWNGEEGSFSGPPVSLRAILRAVGVEPAAFIGQLSKVVTACRMDDMAATVSVSYLF
ncbi:unnamed protein product [Phaeothamnion confervicola]